MLRNLALAVSAAVFAHTAAAQDLLSRGGVDSAIVHPQTDAHRAVARAFVATKARVDSLIERNKPEPKLFARLGTDRKDCPTPSDSVVTVANPGKWPKIHTVRYAVYADAAGHIVAARESPFSCSGDWAINYTYYFDATGRTIGFERFSGFFSGCGFTAHETTTFAFDAGGALASKQYALTDSKEQPQSSNGCTFFYHMDYAIHATWAAYALAAGLPEHP